ncbi:MAG TPA: hypothetical protein VF173_28735 [Thermoanaerobaculia bacterium]|nr:hypothetical protein [Thermoanaerobaculia bacterium]
MVDASVARSAGWEGTADLLSRQCREVLEVIKSIHSIVFSKESLAEWRKHSSGFARTWLIDMYGRKKVISAGDIKDEGFRVRLLRSASSASVRAAMEKDAHLIEAANRHDRIVLSRDEAMRQILRDVAAEIREVAQILWANPALESDRVLPWLENGARMEAARRLGSSRSE